MGIHVTSIHRSINRSPLNILDVVIEEPETSELPRKRRCKRACKPSKEKQPEQAEGEEEEAPSSLIEHTEVADHNTRCFSLQRTECGQIHQGNSGWNHRGGR